MDRAWIPVDSSTKERLDRLRRDDESWDELLTRVLPGDEPIDVGAWSDETAGRARESIENSRENWRRGFSAVGSEIVTSDY